MTDEVVALRARVAELEADLRELRSQDSIRGREFREKCAERDRLMLDISDQSRSYERDLKAAREEAAKLTLEVSRLRDENARLRAMHQGAA